MDYYTKTTDETVLLLSSDQEKGLTYKSVENNLIKYGKNVLSEKKKQSFISKVFCALKEPMLIILLFGFVITLGANLGKYLRTGTGDFVECFGILFAVILSVFFLKNIFKNII